MMPLLKNTKYTGTVTDCSAGSFLFQYKSETYPFTLFNVLYAQEGANEACSRLLGTSTIEIENDLLAPSDEVYVFVDGELLQVALIRDGYARVKIANPEYKYYKELVEIHTEDVSSELEILDNITEFDRSRAQQFFAFQFFGIFLIYGFLMVRKIVKKVI